VPDSDFEFWETDQLQVIKFILIDVKGRLVLKEEIRQPKHELDVSGISKGVYLLKINEQTKKIVIE
jgi:hypothetical protein